jgi:hypothetical protein
MRKNLKEVGSFTGLIRQQIEARSLWGITIHEDVREKEGNSDNP